MAQKGFFIDLSRCTGCRTCTIACADLKNTPIGLYNRTVNEYEGGGWKKDKDGLWSPEKVSFIGMQSMLRSGLRESLSD